MSSNILSLVDKKMKAASEGLKTELATIRTGRASPALIEHLKIDYAGTPYPLNQIAGISAPEARLLVIQPWDKSILGNIEKSIRERSDLGFNPVNDGNSIHINIPQPTEERRKDLVKVANSKTEEAKISVRNARHKAHAQIKSQLKEKEISEDESKALEKELQDLVDNANNRVDELNKAKEKDIMTV